MRQVLKYKNHILLLLIIAFLIGCGAKDNNNNSSINSDQLGESLAPSESFENIDDKIKLIEKRVATNASSIEKINETVMKINKLIEASTDPIGLFFLSIIVNIIILITALLLLNRLKLSKNRKKQNNQSTNNKHLEGKVTKLSYETSNLREELKNAIKKIESLENKKRQVMPIAKKDEEAPIISKKDSKPKDVYIQQPTKYLSGINKKLFTVVDTSPDGSFFKIINQKGTIAEFTLHGSEEEAIAKRVFNEQNSNIIAGNLQTAKKVEIVNVGKIEQEGNNWVVTKPIEVKLI